METVPEETESWREKVMFMNDKVREHIKKQNLNFDRTVFLYLVFFKVVPLIGLPIYFFYNDFTWGPWITCTILYFMTGMSITIGYHRLFAHKAFKANPWVERALLLFGAMSLQNSCLKWSSDHRTHHSFTDTDKDPYNAKLGFWWSHIVWIFFTPNENRYVKNNDVSMGTLKKEFPNCQDLIQNPRVLKQHLYGHKLGLLSNFFLVGTLGLYFNDFWGYLLIGGFLRIVMVHQVTFCINSIAHMFGETPHSEEHTAKDSFYCAALTFGEGYHNFHHTFPNDYRCGTSLHHVDISKWVIFGWSKLGLAWDLKRTPKSKYAHGAKEVLSPREEPVAVESLTEKDFKVTKPV